MKKNLPFYLILTLIIIGVLWLAVSRDQIFHPVGLSRPGAGTESFSWFTLFNHLTERLFQSPGILVLQLILIMLAARLMGFLFQRIGQPLVVGEIIAGIMMGPSVLGALFPRMIGFLFPAHSVELLEQLSQLGLIFFMFIIGMELDVHSFRRSANKAVLISITSISFPFLTGILLSFFLYPGFSSPQVHFTSFALFLGTTMSITAFPILARIVQERKYAQTPVGNMAISAAAVGDVLAWCMLAVVITFAKSAGIGSGILTIVLSVIYILVMLLIVKPFMFRLGRVYASRESMSKPVVAFVFLLILVSTLITDAIGINPLFGAFLAGVTMPENLNFKRVFTEKIEDVSLVILLPLFFVATGLRTEIGLINTPHLWIICLLIVFAAIFSKVVGTYLASRYTGFNNRQSLTLGFLMNSRGLMELIVLNIGYDLGILNPEIFAMLVIMALGTTFLTGPGLNLVDRFRTRPVKQPVMTKTHRIFLSFANPKMGDTLLSLAHQISAARIKDTRFTALHFSPRSDLSPEDAVVFERESFAPIRHYAETNSLPLQTLYRNTTDIQGEILRTCAAENPEFIILGSARSVFSTDILGGILKRIILDSVCDVLVFNEHHFQSIRSVLLYYTGQEDDHLMGYLALIGKSGNRKFYTFAEGNSRPATETLAQYSFLQMEFVGKEQLQLSFLHKLDLMIVSDNSWKKLEKSKWIPVAQLPSLLIIHAAGNR
jgi:Kef-type K+ transport system membrane component KefB